MRLTIKESKKEGTEITHSSGEENYLNLTVVILLNCFTGIILLLELILKIC